jgi:hypothetical protein
MTSKVPGAVWSFRPSFPAEGKQVSHDPAQADKDEIHKLERDVVSHQMTLPGKFARLPQDRKINKTF